LSNLLFCIAVLVDDESGVIDGDLDFLVDGNFTTSVCIDKGGEVRSIHGLVVFVYQVFLHYYLLYAACL